MMKRPLCIGIYELSPAWISLLDQLGVWYQKVTSKTRHYNSYSLIIANKPATKERKNELNSYLKQGGNVIFINIDYGFFPDKRFNSKYLKRVYNDLRLDSLQHIPYLDLYTEVKTKAGTKLSDLIVFKKVMNGQVAFIGFDPADLLFQTEYSRKQFSSSIANKPDEIVSNVSKGLISDFFLQILREIHFKAELPFIRKWTSPDHKPVFCFRIDSDFSDRDHIDRVYSILNDRQIRATWFLHVIAHEDWLNYFSDLENQEIALHGYNHGTSRNENKVIKNISEGLNKLNESDLEINGFCAPYGIYDRALENALENFDFKYTSEFTFAYDSYPVKCNQNRLQIPIHPICTGSLKRKQYDKKEMLSYFYEVLERKLARHEPVIFYHHPLQTGLKIFDSIFERITELGLINLTFEQFSDFWNDREKCTFEAYWLGDSVRLIGVSDKSQLFEISYNHESSQLVNSVNSVFDKKSKYDIQYDLRYSSEDHDHHISMIDKLRLLKTSIFDLRNRERL